MSPLPSIKNMSSKTKAQVTFMCALVAVGLLLWGRLLLKHLPRTAIAEPEAAAVLEAKPTTPAAKSKALVRFSKPTPVSRDVFTLDASKYARVAKAEQPSPVVVEAVVPEKSRSETADEQQRIREAQRAASSLTLQSTVLGDSPRAVINGVPVAPGKKIGGFLVKQIHARYVVIEMNGVEIKLEM